MVWQELATSSTCSLDVSDESGDDTDEGVVARSVFTTLGAKTQLTIVIKQRVAAK